MQGNNECIAAFGTELFTRDDGFDSCDVQFLGGSGYERWKHLLGDVEEWARKQGCKFMNAVARDGIGKKILIGYRPGAREFQKEL